MSPGNSGGPPATVPSYNAVVVSSSITKSRPAISGYGFDVVILQTNPGYNPVPGHTGTGTIVATPC